MAHVLRVVLVVLLVACCGSASAAFPKGYGWEWDESGVPKYDTPEAACVGYLTRPGSTENRPFSRVNVYGTAPNRQGQCYVKNPTGDDSANGGVKERANYCPSNSTTTGTSCTCTPPYVEGTGADAGKCVPKPDVCATLKGALVSGTAIDWVSVTKGANYGCVGGTGANAQCQTVAWCDYTTQVPGQVGYTCRGLNYVTGSRASSCSGSGDSPDSPSAPAVQDPQNPNAPPTPGHPVPSPCPAGQAPGSFNGTSMCQPTGSDTATGTDAPGNGSSTVNRPDGSSTTTTQSGRTECLQGKCTTTTNNNTVITNRPGDTSCPAGSTAGTTTKDGKTVTTCSTSTTGTSIQPQSGFCKDNPGNKQCGGSGSGDSFGGSCASGFKAISEDAVINAMAEEQYKRNCQMFETDSEERKGYEDDKAKAKAGTDLTDGMGDKYKRAVSIGPGSFDSSSLIAASQCIRDLDVTVMGASVKLPFSRICPYLEYMGTLLMAVSFLLAARIVVRG